MTSLDKLSSLARVGAIVVLGLVSTSAIAEENIEVGAGSKIIDH